MNKAETRAFIAKQVKIFIKKGGIIKVGRTRKQNASNTSFSRCRNTVAHRGRKSITLAQKQFSGKHFA